jgi:predicted N-acyltransferase
VAEASVRVVDDPASLDAQAWNRLAHGHPFLRHEFFAALHETGCATARTGWAPQFLVLEREGALAGAMPLYLKSHSFGEYVFDWAWADAYQRHGFEYYPKLLAAVPFSPISAPKLLARDEDAKRALIRAALALARQTSSLHVLFPTPAEARLLAESGCMLRRGVQFHWENRGYADFEAFLATLSHDKRKKIKQERRKVREAGVTLRRLVGAEIGSEEWRFFARCYTNTYRQHLSTPYLTRAFFERLGKTLGEHLLLVIAERDGRPIASALDVFTGETLYGRYWGSVEHVPALHFEACYYQAIEFAIERGIAVFEGGAQGEHKLARGFLPVETLSAHWLAHPEFARAVADFLEREGAGVADYLDELNERRPFKA